MPKGNDIDMFIETAKGLLALGIEDGEIIASLQESGLSKEEAVKVLSEVKGEPVSEEAKLERLVVEEEVKKKAKKKGRPVEEPEEEAEEESEEGLGEEALEEMLEEGEPKSKLVVKKPLVKKVLKAEEIEEAETEMPAIKPKIVSAKPRVEAPWEEGIISLVNHKIEEMDQKKTEFEELIQTKLKTELEKIKVVFDSQKTLLLTKVNTEIESKLGEITALAESFDESLKSIEVTKKANESILAKMDEKISQVDEIRSDVLSQVNAMLIKQGSETKQLLQNAKLEHDQAKKTISDSLSLESKIIKDLIAETQENYKNFIDEKEAELSEFFERVQAVKKQKEAVEGLSDEITQKINTLDTVVARLQDKETELQKELEQRIGEKRENALKAMEKEEKLFSDALDEKLKTKMEMFEEDVSRQIKGIQDSVSSIIKDEEDRFTEKINTFLNRKSVELDDRVEKKIYDLTTKEEVFEKSFSRVTQQMNEKQKLVIKMFSSISIFFLVTAIALISVMFLMSFPAEVFVLGLVLAVLFFIFGVVTLYFFVTRKPLVVQ